MDENPEGGVSKSMFDTRPVLADMASQIRFHRSSEGFTLQQLAARSGVAASTIHKVESQQMVPTVSVLFKIAQGLKVRPEDLIRDHFWNIRTENAPSDSSLSSSEGQGRKSGLRSAGVWRIALDRDQGLPLIILDSQQVAMVLVESGILRLQTEHEQTDLQAGACVEISSGGSIQSMPGQPTRITLIISPPGDIDQILGTPHSAPRCAGQTAS